jgi:SAM-dependent methyltransferase
MIPIKVIAGWIRWRFWPLVKNIGVTYECPICGYHGKNYAVRGRDLSDTQTGEVYGMGLRRDECPLCHTTARHRLLFLYLRDSMGLFKTKGKSVLHIAPERIIKWKLKKFTKYQAGDSFCKGYSYDSDVMPLDIMNLPFEEAKYDIIICLHVLEHVWDDIKAMTELYRVLRHGGVAFIQAPVSPNMETTREIDKNAPPQASEDELFRQFGQRNHYRLYAMSDYVNRLSKAGFDVELYRPTEDVIEKYNLYNEQYLFVCHKN